MFYLVSLNKKLFLCFYLICLSGCLHINDKIEYLPIKSTKIKIIKKLGQPMKIQRIDGMDYWTYKVVIEERHYTRTIIIKEGVLYKKGRLKPYPLKSF